MGLLFIAAVVAAKKYNDEMSRSHRSSKKGSGNDSSSSYNYSYSSVMTPADYMIEEMKQSDSILYPFFDELISEYESYLKNKYKAFMDQRVALQKKIDEKSPNLRKLYKLLNSDGSCFRSTLRKTIKVDDEFEFDCEYKGRSVLSVIEEKYQSLVKEHEEKEKEIKKLEETIEVETRRAKFAIFKRREKKEHVESLKRDCSTLISRNRRLQEKIESLGDFLKKVTANRELFEKAMKEIIEPAELEKQKCEVSSKEKYYNELRFMTFIDDVIMTKIFEKLLSEGKITPESMERICSLVEKKEKMVDKSKKQNRKFSDMSYDRRRRFEATCDWFMKNVFDNVKNVKKEEPQKEEAPKKKLKA